MQQERIFEIVHHQPLLPSLYPFKHEIWGSMDHNLPTYRQGLVSGRLMDYFEEPTPLHPISSRNSGPWLPRPALFCPMKCTMAPQMYSKPSSARGESSGSMLLSLSGVIFISCMERSNCLPLSLEMCGSRYGIILSPCMVRSRSKSFLPLPSNDN